MEELEDDRQISSGSEGEALVVALVVASLRGVGSVGGLIVITDACSDACSELEETRRIQAAYSAAVCCSAACSACCSALIEFFVVLF